MNKLANAIMGYSAGGSGGAPQSGSTLGNLAANAPAASAPTTAAPTRGLGPVAGAPPVPPASPRPPSPLAPAGAMTGQTSMAPTMARAAKKPSGGTTASPIPKLAAEMLRENLLRGEMPASMKPIKPPSPPKPPKPFSPKPPGTQNDFRLGSTTGTI